MKGRRFVAIAGVLGMWGATACDSARAELLAYEGFDTAQYTGSTLGSTNGGTGWSTGWKSNAALTTDSGASVISTSLSAPPGYAPAPLGGSAEQTSILAYRGLIAAAQIDLNVDQDYYISYLAKRSGATGAYAFSLQSGTTTVIAVSAATGGAITTSGLGTTTSSSTSPIGNNTTEMWVIKISARAASPDQVFVQNYDASQPTSLPSTEPTTWTHQSNTDAKTSTISQILFSGGSGRILQIDEIRIGQTWADVVPVPEPAGAMLMCGGAAALMGRRSTSERSASH